MPDLHVHPIRKKMFWVTAILSLAVMLAFSLAAYSFKSSHDAAKRERKILCNAQNNSNDALRKVLLLAQSLAVARKGQTADERTAAADFYGRALQLVGHVPCQEKPS